MNLRFANKHPFLFCAMMVSCAVAFGGGIACTSGNVNFSYGSISGGLVMFWICIGLDTQHQRGCYK